MPTSSKRADRAHIRRELPKLRIKLVFTGAAAIILLTHGASGQYGAAKPEFEVVDIRQNRTNQQDRYHRILPGSQIAVRNVTMRELIEFAFNSFRDGQISGGPSWLDSDRFDLSGKATPGTSDDTLRLMLRNFLATEVKLAVHEAQRPVNGYALVLRKGGPKLQKAAGSGNASCRQVLEDDPAVRNLFAGQNELVCTNMTTTDLAKVLPGAAPGYVDGPVQDLTDLKGTFDFKLSWVVRSLIDQGGLTIFDAVDKQLGLQLKPRKVSIPFFVIDHVEKPATVR